MWPQITDSKIVKGEPSELRIDPEKLRRLVEEQIENIRIWKIKIFGNERNITKQIKMMKDEEFKLYESLMDVTTTYGRKRSYCI